MYAYEIFFVPSLIYIRLWTRDIRHISSANSFSTLYSNFALLLLPGVKILNNQTSLNKKERKKKEIKSSKGSEWCKNYYRTKRIIRAKLTGLERLDLN